MIIQRIVVLVLFLPLFAAAKNEPNLCSSSEPVVFSCSIKKKIVSLCATHGLTANSGHLTYRFGPLKGTPELIYPTEELKPASVFSAHFEFGAKTSFGWVMFTRGNYDYVVYNRSAVYEESSRSNGGGVRIFRSGKEIADMWCANSSIDDKMWETLNELGLPDAEWPGR